MTYLKTFSAFLLILVSLSLFLVGCVAQAPVATPTGNEIAGSELAQIDEISSALGEASNISEVADVDLPVSDIP